LDNLVCHDMLPHSAYSGAYAREWAHYKRALARVEDDLGDGGPMNAKHPLTLMDEAAVALVNAAWHEGTHIGAAFARAEDELDAPWRICGQCNGTGAPRDNDEHAKACRGCGGKGFVTRDGEWVRG
jgi:hypothetical protein